MLTNPIELTTVELGGMRLYKTPEGNHYPSITSILGRTMEPEKVKSLDNWRNSLGHANAHAYTKKAADKGTNVHALCEKFLKNEVINLKQFSIEDVNVFAALKLKLKNIKPIAQEIALYSDRLEIGGRVDCIGYYKDVISIIDFKTSNKNKLDKDVLDYKLQICFYALACNELYGTDIQQGVIIMSSGTGFPLEWIFDIRDFIKPLEKRIDEFYINLAKSL